MAYIAYADGRIETIDIPTRERAREIVGGYVESVFPRLSPEVVMLVDEEGNIKNKPMNRIGTGLYGAGEICGDIVVLTRGEVRGTVWGPDQY